MLRIDRATQDGTSLIGTLKPYATDGALNEQPSEDVDVQQWDGIQLSFVRRALPGQPAYTGTAVGRTLSGVASLGRRHFRCVVGDPARRGPDPRARRANRGRRGRLADPDPEATWAARVRREPATFRHAGRRPRDGHPIPAFDHAARDDDASSWPQGYVLHELVLASRVPALVGAEVLARQAHAYVAVPSTPAPPGGYPVALALNGHGGSAYDVFDPAGLYWYGDSFARRGFVVVAVDVGHRPLADRASVYDGYTAGDDPATGNGLHPAIEPPGVTSDWEEDGERAWDAMRGLDYALGRPDVNPAAVVAVGLSMGGEITDWVGAMDGRVGIAVAAGNPSDLAIMRLHGNHPCWQWQRGDIREYVDPGDLNALVAPRVLVRETGLADGIYSSAPRPSRPPKRWSGAPDPRSTPLADS